MKYGFSVAQPALAKLLMLPERDRWLLHDRFASVARHPFAEPDLRLRDQHDRVIAVRVEDEWLIHYWVDHAVAQVIILDVEQTRTDDA